MEINFQKQKRWPRVIVLLSRRNVNPHVKGWCIMGYMLPGFSLIRSGVWFSFGSQLCIWLFDLAKSVLLSERDLVILHSASS